MSNPPNETSAAQRIAAERAVANQWRTQKTDTWVIFYTVMTAIGTLFALLSICVATLNVDCILTAVFGSLLVVSAVPVFYYGFFSKYSFIFDIWLGYALFRCTDLEQVVPPPRWVRTVEVALLYGCLIIRAVNMASNMFSKSIQLIRISLANAVPWGCFLGAVAAYYSHPPNKFLLHILWLFVLTFLALAMALKVHLSVCILFAVILYTAIGGGRTLLAEPITVSDQIALVTVGVWVFTRPLLLLFHPHTDAAQSRLIIFNLKCWHFKLFLVFNVFIVLMFAVAQTVAVVGQKKLALALAIYVPTLVVWLAFYVVYCWALWSVCSIFCAKQESLSTTNSIESVVKAHCRQTRNAAAQMLPIMCTILTTSLATINYAYHSPFSALSYALLATVEMMVACVTYTIYGHYENCSVHAMLLPKLSEQQVEDDGRMLATRLSQFFAHKAFDVDDVAYATDNIPLESAVGKLKAFFSGNTEYGYPYDTYILYFRGRMCDTGENLRFSDGPLSMEDLLTLWKENHANNNSRLFVLLDAENAIQWCLQAASVKDVSVGVQTYLLDAGDGRPPGELTTSVLSNCFADFWLRLNSDLDGWQSCAAPMKLLFKMSLSGYCFSRCAKVRRRFVAVTGLSSYFMRVFWYPLRRAYDIGKGYLNFKFPASIFDTQQGYRFVSTDPA